MPVSTLPSAEEFEEKGHAEVEFVGFRYTGDQSARSDLDVRERAGYNGPAKFQQGQVYLALLATYLDPDHVENSGMGVHALEARNDFEVIYDPGRLAEALLDRNYLPPDIFYEGFDRWKRQKVMDKLGLDDHGRVFEKDDETPYREELREIAGIKRDDSESPSQQRSDEYVSRFSRSDAMAVVRELRRASLPDLPFEPSEHTIGELEDELATDDEQEWDTDTLQALLAAERAGDDRKGAREAIREVAGGDLEPVDHWIDVESAGLTDMAEYMTRFDPATVDDAVDEALGEE
jgi:hypothetical protein